MTHKLMQGVFPILVTPFDEQEQVDVTSLQRLVEHLIDEGVHGLGIALGSEVMRLTEAERALVTRTVAQQARGRVPLVVNVGGASTVQAQHYARLAIENGADALMLTAPGFMPAGGDLLRAHFAALAQLSDLPIFIQDTGSNHIPAATAREIAAENPTVRYIKVESGPPAQKVGQAVEEAGDTLTVFGGSGGSYFLEELRRGSQGTMPGCAHAAAFVAVWDRYHAGDEEGARALFYERILPLNRLANQGWSSFYFVHKEILRRRGVLRHAIVRSPAASLDEMTLAELDALMA